MKFIQNIKNKGAITLATWFGSGYLKPAPGTWGSLAAIPPGIGLYAVSGPPGLLAGVILISLVGYYASVLYCQNRNVTGDPKEIVIDEVAGQWIALIPAGLNIWLVILAFALFRFFDVVKVWPANMIDRKLKSPLGIMLDDIVAGFYAAVFVILFRSFL